MWRFIPWAARRIQEQRWMADRALAAAALRQQSEREAAFRRLIEQAHRR